MKTDIQSLTKILNIPNSPLECRYQITTKNDFFNEQQIIAALKYENAIIENIRANSSPYSGSTDFLDQNIYTTWLPEEIRSKFSKNDEYLEIINNANVFSTDNFSKGSFNNGFIIINSPWIFIYCYSM